MYVYEYFSIYIRESIGQKFMKIKKGLFKCVVLYGIDASDAFEQVRKVFKSRKSSKFIRLMDIVCFFVK